MSKNDLRMLEVVPRSICDRTWEKESYRANNDFSV